MVTRRTWIQRRPLKWWLILVIAFFIIWFGLEALVTGKVVLSPNPLFEIYADMARGGQGFVLHPDEFFLLTIHPLYIPFYTLIGFPKMLLAAGITIGGASLYATLRMWGASVLATGILCVLWALFFSADANAWAATALLVALVCLVQKRFALAGLAVALACGFALPFLPFALFLGLYAASQKRGWPFGLAFLLPFGLMVALLAWYYGPGLWEVFNVPGIPPPPQLASLVCFGVFMLLVFFLRFIKDDHKSLYAALLLSVLACIAFAPNIPITLYVAMYMVLSMLGFAHMPKGPKRSELMTVWAIAFVSLLVITAYFGVLISVTRPSSPTHFEVLVILRNARLTTKIVDLEGIWQPPIREMRERGDFWSILIRYAPQVFGTEDKRLLEPKVLAGLGYEIYDDLSTIVPPQTWTHIRDTKTETGAWRTRTIDQAFGPDIRLASWAYDEAVSQPNGVTRLRLDWQMRISADQAITVYIEAMRGDKTIASTRDEVAASILRAGPWSTYHVLPMLPPDQRDGLVFYLTLKVNNAQLGRVLLAP
jgi:hypothetical protein